MRPIVGSWLAAFVGPSVPGVCVVQAKQTKWEKVDTFTYQIKMEPRPHGEKCRVIRLEEKFKVQINIHMPLKLYLLNHKFVGICQKSQDDFEITYKGL